MSVCGTGSVVSQMDVGGEESTVDGLPASGLLPWTHAGCAHPREGNTDGGQSWASQDHLAAN